MPEYAQNEPEKAISKHVFSVYSDGVCKGEAERSRKWGVGGSLRQNRYFAADSPLAPTHTLFLVIDSFLLVVSEVLLLASGAPFRTRKQKRVFPLWLASLDARKHSGGVLAHSLIPLLIFTCKPCNGTK